MPVPASLEYARPVASVDASASLVALTLSAPLASTVTPLAIVAVTVGLTTDMPIAPAARTVPPCCRVEAFWAVPP